MIEKARLDAKSLQRTYREIAILKTLRHPHLVTLYQVTVIRIVLVGARPYNHLLWLPVWAGTSLVVVVGRLLELYSTVAVHSN